MEIVKYRKINYIFSSILAVVSVISLLSWGFNFGIDFTGGSLMEVSFTEERLSNDQIKEALKDFDLGEISVQPSGEKDAILRFKNIDEVKHQEILTALGNISKVEEKRFDSIGPVIGQELKKRAVWAMFFSLAAILIFITWSFRHVSRLVPSWHYGMAAIIALFHDVLIICGTFSLLGHFHDVEVGVPFVAAVLTILGFSVHDTIVVFDRIRENIMRGKNSDNFEGTVDKSISETIVRSINTSLTVIFVLLIMLLFGGETVRYFILALLVGVFFGTYSSIFIASPLLITWHNYDMKKK